MNDFPRPLAIGILGLPHATDRQVREARIRLALTANAEGYALLETFQLTGIRRTDDSLYATIEALASRLEAMAVLLSGDVDQGRIEGIAERVRLTVVKTPCS